MTTRFPAVFFCCVLLSASSAGQVSWTPGFELIPSTCSVNTGGSFSVDIFLSNVGGPVSGYQAEIAFDPSRVTVTGITQGPYLPFLLFLPSFGPTSSTARVGGLNVPIPTNLGPGAGLGVIATVTFQTLVPGPVHLDVTDFCLLSLPGGSATVAGATKDYVVQVQDPGDTLSVCGPPNLGENLMLLLSSPGNGGAFAVTAGALSNSGIPVPGVGIVPLAFDPLLDLSLQNVYPFSGSVGFLDPAGNMMTTFTIPPVPSLIGTRFWFASVISAGGVLTISNGTFVDVLIA